MINKEEYSPFYQTYIDKANLNEAIVWNLETSLKRCNNLLQKVTAEKELFQYEENKWTIREIVMHLIDAEMVFNYRALRFSRNDQTDLAGFNENDYVESSNANDYALTFLNQSLIDLRQHTIKFYRSLNQNMLLKGGTANSNFMSVRALGYVTAGHLLHHLEVIEKRYL